LKGVRKEAVAEDKMDWKTSSNATDTWNNSSTTVCSQLDVPASNGCVSFLNVF